MEKQIILASASPRRRMMLETLGIKHICLPSQIDESLIPGEQPETMVERIAWNKALAAGESASNSLIIAADTIVVCDGQVLGKPCDENDAFIKLASLSGKWHEVISAVCVYDTDKNISEVESEITRVYFRNISDEEIWAYIASGEAMDKAGAYGIQGLASVFVERIEGSYYNVVGLPVARLYWMLKRQGYDVLGV